MQETWDEILGLENNDYETLKETLLKYKNKIDTKISKLTLEGRRVSN
jgi:low affinity Fe/Cu permease